MHMWNKIEGLPFWSSGKTLPSNGGGANLTPGQGEKIPQASQSKHQNTNQKQYRNKFNKDF